jgi:hypothetical protein
MKNHVATIKSFHENPKFAEEISKEELEKYEINVLSYFKYFFAKC